MSLISRIWNRRKYVDIAVRICETLKYSLETGSFDLFATAVDIVIPGDQSGVTKFVKAKLTDNLPKMISSLQLVSIIAHIDPNDVKAQAQAVYDSLTKGSDAALTSVWQGLSDEIFNMFEDGKLSTAERRKLIDDYYTKYIKK